MSKYDHKRVGEVALQLQDWMIKNDYTLIDIERAASLIKSAGSLNRNCSESETK